MSVVGQIPIVVEEKLSRLSKAISVPLDVLKEEYIKWYEEVSRDPQFTNDEERHAYAIRSFWAMKVARPPTRRVWFIPIGYTEDRKSRSSGDLMCRIYGIYSEDNEKWEKTVLIGRGSEAKIWKELIMFSKYQIEVTPGRGVLWAVPETRFENEVPLNLSTEGKISFLKKIGIKVFQLRTVYKSLSRVEEGGYVNEWDLRGIYGIVMGYRSGQRSDGSKWAQYIINDDSVTPNDNVDEDGNVIPTSFTVWVPSSMLKYGKLSELFFYGTVQLGGDGIPFMNAIGVIPIVPKSLEG